MIGKSRNKRTRVYRSSVTNRELVVEPAPHVTGHMTKDLLMKYTFVALCILAATAVLAFGITALVMEIVAVVVAIISYYMLSRVMREKGPINIYSAAVSGLVVALSFTSGVPVTYNAGDLAYLGISEGQPFISTIMDSNIQYLAVAIISALAVILFKKIQGLLGRKYLNPAAAAKLLVLGPLYTMSLIPSDHLNIANMSAEALTKPLPLLPSGAGLEGTLAFCYAGSNAPFPDEVLMDGLPWLHQMADSPHFSGDNSYYRNRLQLVLWRGYNLKSGFPSLHRQRHISFLFYGHRSRDNPLNKHGTSHLRHWSQRTQLRFPDIFRVSRRFYPSVSYNEPNCSFVKSRRNQ